MSRGLSNCNPGNIRQSKVRYKGEVQPSRDPAFKQFESLAWGYRAVFVLLHTYRVRHGLRTVRGMISRWAPPVENHTEAYIRAVAADTGIDPDEPLDTLDPATMIPPGRRHLARGKRHGGGPRRNRTRLGAVFRLILLSLRLNRLSG